jgi:hypothetical protein
VITIGTALPTEAHATAQAKIEQWNDVPLPALTMARRAIRSRAILRNSSRDCRTARRVTPRE